MDRDRASMRALTLFPRVLIGALVRTVRGLITRSDLVGTDRITDRARGA